MMKFKDAMNKKSLGSGAKVVIDRLSVDMKEEEGERSGGDVRVIN